MQIVEQNIIKFWNEALKQMILGYSLGVMVDGKEVKIQVATWPGCISLLNSLEKDRTGSYIYEGDIVKFRTKRYHGKDYGHYEWFLSEVVYEEGSFIISEGKDYFDTPLYSMLANDENMLEIVGNKYQDPDLYKLQLKKRGIK